MLVTMSDVTRLLDAAAAGDPTAAADLLPPVYAELRKLAAARLAGEKAGHTLQPTALVHEAYLRLVGGRPAATTGTAAATSSPPRPRPCAASWSSPPAARAGSGTAAAAGAVDLDDAAAASDDPTDDLLALDDALTRLEAADPAAAQLVKLRYFAGLTMPEAAAALGVPLRTAERNWTFARAWLHRELARAS